MGGVCIQTGEQPRVRRAQSSGWRCAIGFLVFVAPVFGTTAFGQGQGQGQGQKKAITYGKAEKLIVTGAFPKRWKYVSSDKNSKLADTWQLDDTTDKKNPFLICKGMPSGYVRTIDKYTNFDLHLEWFYPKNPNANSGILIHCGEDKVWPASVQVQLHRPLAGSIFPLKGATTINKVQVKNLKLSVGVWHTCRILSENGTITLWINKKRIGAVTGCKPASGYIGLQSEGSEIRFRRFEIRIPIVKKKTATKKKAPTKRVKPKKKVPSPKRAEIEPKRTVSRYTAIGIE